MFCSPEESLRGWRDEGEALLRWAVWFDVSSPHVSLSSGSSAVLNSPLFSVVLSCFQVRGHVLTWLSIINMIVPVLLLSVTVSSSYGKKQSSGI